MNQQAQQVQQLQLPIRDSPTKTSIDLQDITNYQLKNEKSHSLDSLNGMNYDPYKKQINLINSKFSIL
jgi:hypothetical protein